MAGAAAGASGAAGSISVEIRGLIPITTGLIASAREFEDMRSANWRVSERIVQRARVYVPVKTGRLSGSIRGIRSRGEAKVQAGGPNVPYARVQHYGWPAHHIRASLFLTKAQEDCIPDAVTIYKSEVQKIMDGVRGA